MKKLNQGKALIFIFIFISILIFFNNQNCLAVGVKPLTLTLELKPGQTANFDIQLISAGQKEVVNLSFYELIQKNDGGLAYEEYDGREGSALNWIEVDRNDYEVSAGEDEIIKGKIKVPFDAGGSYPVVLMVEPQTEREQNGISFRVRYAVRINIRVNHPGLRNEAELLEWGLTKGEEGEPLIEAIIHNSSPWDYLMSGELTIRDNNRKLVERIKLNTATDEQNNKDLTRIYPGSTVNYNGRFTRRLDPGQYTIRIFMGYGDHGQIIKSKNISISAGDINFSNADEIGAFTVEPGKIELQLAPGQIKTEVLNINSEIGENSQINISAVDIMPEYKYSNLEWLKLRSEAVFMLKERQTGRVILTTNIPREIAEGSYHGKLVLNAFSTESDELLEREEVPVTVVVGNDFNPEVEVRSLEYNQSEDDFLMSLDLYNCGNVLLSPEAVIVITDTDNKLVAETNLSLPEDGDEILPLQKQLLTGLINKLEPGSYQLSISIRNNGEEILKTSDNLVIEAD